MSLQCFVFSHLLCYGAVDQPGEPESVLDYTKLWSDLIDRGGIYHINEEVCECLTVHACMDVCTCVLSDIRLHLCRVRECLYAEVITWLIIVSLAGVPFDGVH